MHYRYYPKAQAARDQNESRAPDPTASLAYRLGHPVG
jgi:hypothetical protein